MKLSKRHKQWVSILFALAIVLSGTCTGISQSNAFLAFQNISEEVQISSLQKQESNFCDEKQSERNTTSQRYQVTHTSFAKEDCRIEENSARTLQKVISVREEKRGSRGKSEESFMKPTGLFFKCLKIIQNQYIEQSKAIVSLHEIIITFIHRKDGAKGIRLFF